MEYNFRVQLQIQTHTAQVDPKYVLSISQT